MFGPDALDRATHVLLQFDPKEPGTPYVVKPSGNGKFDLYQMERADDPTLRITCAYAHGSWIGYEHSSTHETDMRPIGLIWAGVPWSTDKHDVQYWVVNLTRIVNNTDELKALFIGSYCDGSSVRDHDLDPELLHADPAVVADALAEKYAHIDSSDERLIFIVAGTRVFIHEYSLFGSLFLYMYIQEYGEQLRDRKFIFANDVLDINRKFLNPLIEELKAKQTQVES